jgi:hypothetical protein
MAKRHDNVVPITHIPAINRETGEVMDMEVLAKRGRKRSGRRRVFAMIDLEAMERLDLTGLEFKVLARIARAANAETNEAWITQEQIAHALGSVQPSVARAIRTLKERRIIFPLARRGYRVNPHILFRGAVPDWNDATDMEKEPIWTR